MSVAGSYYRDTARVQKYQGINDRGDAAYSNELSVLCRFNYTQKETLDSKGNIIISTATMFTDEFIPSLSIVYDALNNRFTVKNCKCIKRLTGETDHYEVSL